MNKNILWNFTRIIFLNLGLKTDNYNISINNIYIFIIYIF